MAIRTIKRSLTAFPETDATECVWAGYQFEDNATELVFDISEINREGMLYRIDFNSSVAGYHPSENLTAELGLIRRTVPEYLTRCGGELQATAVATLAGEESIVCYSYPITLCLTSVNKNERGDSTVAANISQMEKVVEALMLSARKAAETAELCRQQTEAARFSLENGSELVLLGGDAEKAISAELVMDSAMSDLSENPVQNKVIKQYIDSEIAKLSAAVGSNT